MDWHPIKTAPEEINVLVSDGKQVAVAELDKDDWWAKCGDIQPWDGDSGALQINFTPTHWMALPAPPA